MYGLLTQVGPLFGALSGGAGRGGLSVGFSFIRGWVSSPYGPVVIAKVRCDGRRRHGEVLARQNLMQIPLSIAPNLLEPSQDIVDETGLLGGMVPARQSRE